MAARVMYINSDRYRVALRQIDQTKPHRWKHFPKLIDDGKVKLGDIVDRTGNGDLWRVLWVVDVEPE